MSLDEQKRMLDNDDAEVRRRAIVSLRGSTDPDAGALVMAALGDDDWRVRKEAVEVAGVAAEQLGLTDALVQAICQGENVGLRNAALDVLETLGPRAAPQLMKALPTVPEHARKFVVEALGESGGAAVLDELSAAANSEDPNVAGEAIEALARIGGSVAEQVMRERLGSSDPFLRMAALDGLNRLRAVIPFSELKPLLHDRLIRRVALSALGRTADREAIPPLLEALQEAGVATRNAAALGLAQLITEGYELRIAVCEALAGADEAVRASLRTILERLEDLAASRAAAQLLTLARDPLSVGGTMRLAVRDAIAPATLEGFRAWGADAIEPLLAAAAELEDPTGNAFALELAADLAALAGETSGGRADAIRAALRSALEQGEPRTSLAAARCMATWAEGSDASLLIRTARGQDTEVGRIVGAALVELARRAPSAVQGALGNVDLSRHGAAIVPAVAALGGTEAFERLQAAVTADDAETRRAAIAALAEVGGAPAADLLALGLADEDRDVQAEAAAALGRVCDEDGSLAGLDALILALSSEASHVRAAAARALGDSGAGERVVEALVSLVDDKDVGVAVAAVEALGRLAPEGLSAKLMGALHHPDSEVIKQALPALVQAGEPMAENALIDALSHPAWDVRRLSAELVREQRLVPARDALARQLPLETDDLARAAMHAALTELEGGG